MQQQQQQHQYQQQHQHHVQQQQHQLHQQRISSLPAFPVSPSTVGPSQASSSNGIGPPPHASYGPNDARSIQNSPVMAHPSLQHIAMTNGPQMQLQRQQQQQQQQQQQLQHHPHPHATRASPSPAKQQYRQVQHEHQQQLQQPSSPHYATHQQQPHQQQQQQPQQPQPPPQRPRPSSAGDRRLGTDQSLREMGGTTITATFPTTTGDWLQHHDRLPQPQLQPQNPNVHPSSEQAQAQGQHAAPLRFGDLRSIFHSYILDYLQKSGLYTAAHAFLRDVPTTPIRPLGPGQAHPASYKGKGRMHESDASCNSPEIDPRTIPQANVQIESPAGFLFEWWTIFYEVFRRRAGPNGVLSSRELVDMSHHAIDVGTRNSSGPSRGPTPVNSQQQSPRRVTAVPPGLQQQQYQRQQQPQPQQYQGNYAGQPSPHPDASAANPTLVRPPPQRIIIASAGSYASGRGGPLSSGGPNSSAYSTPGGAAPQQHATIQASQASQIPPQRGIMANTMGGHGGPPGGPHQTQMQETQPPGPLQRQLSHRATPAQGLHPSQSLQDGPHSGLEPQGQRSACPQSSEQHQRFDAQNESMDMHAPAAMYSGDRQSLINGAQHLTGPPHLSKQQHPQQPQQQHQPVYSGPPQQSAYHSHAQAQSQMENQRQPAPSPLPVVGRSPGHQYPHANASVGSSAELSSQVQALALHQQRVMLANRRSSPTGQGPTMHSNAPGLYASRSDVNSNPPSPAKRFIAANGGSNNGIESQAQHPQPPLAVNTSSPYANGTHGGYGSPVRPDQYGGNYQPVGPAPTPESSSHYASADDASASFRRLASLPNPNNLNSASAMTNAAASSRGFQNSNGANGSSRSSSTTPRLQAIDQTVALQQEISRSQLQAHQLEGHMSAPAVRNVLTPSASATGSKTPAATPGANGLVGAPETPSQYITSPAMLQTPTPQTSRAISPHATTSATTPGSLPMALKQSNTTAAKRKREVAKEASAATKKLRAASAAIAKPPRGGPNERKRSPSAASATTPANVALPPTPSPAVVDTPLPSSTPAPTGIVAPDSTETDPTPSGTVVATPDNLSDSSIFFNPATLEASDPISKLGSTTGGGYYTLDDGGSIGSEHAGVNETGAGAGAGAMTSDEIDALFATSTNSLGSAVPDQEQFVDYTSFFNGANFDGFESLDLTA
ncbi:BQ2448_4086 [Microbotryum intermedium]|uniref:BQ2448_4086 protein n=1 Tax=Microbotryum intermedium TaxID=269621 RepID=A0A238FID7_9BASI|nr:BQ2448_4086 [Microbotryum intermedium]